MIKILSFWMPKKMAGLHHKLLLPPTQQIQHFWLTSSKSAICSYLLFQTFILLTLCFIVHCWLCLRWPFSECCSLFKTCNDCHPAEAPVFLWKSFHFFLCYQLTGQPGTLSTVVMRAASLISKFVVSSEGFDLDRRRWHTMFARNHVFSF